MYQLDVYYATPKSKNLKKKYEEGIAFTLQTSSHHNDEINVISMMTILNFLINDIKIRMSKTCILHPLHMNQYVVLKKHHPPNIFLIGKHYPPNMLGT